MLWERGGAHEPPLRRSVPLCRVCPPVCKGLSLGCPHLGVDVETEAKDRSDLSLPGHQLELLQDAVQAGRASVGPQPTQVFPIHGTPRGHPSSASTKLLVTATSLQLLGAPSFCCYSTRGPWM